MQLSPLMDQTILPQREGAQQICILWCTTMSRFAFSCDVLSNCLKHNECQTVSKTFYLFKKLNECGI